jgi:hypothetical protein
LIGARLLVSRWRFVDVYFRVGVTNVIWSHVARPDFLPDNSRWAVSPPDLSSRYDRFILHGSLSLVRYGQRLDDLARHLPFHYLFHWHFDLNHLFDLNRQLNPPDHFYRYFITDVHLLLSTHTSFRKMSRQTCRLDWQSEHDTVLCKCTAVTIHVKYGQRVHGQVIPRVRHAGRGQRT